ncbi:hypothetical protein [Streptomyces sp. NRRL B-24484]|uniref:hypothetical protein n=1 Tax=Streptomyces sp. NRRL B-24484 TaxID=1463833 RepID=UPI0006932416|nr:hypothetical protein [Streptomyces sp. NRRL B-24484]
MTDPGHATWIGSAAGQTHTGNGAQNNYYIFAAEKLVRGGADPLRMAADGRLWLSRRFANPPGYGEAARRLEGPGTAVLVSGPPGTGRRTTGVVLLHRTGGRDAPFREVALDDREDEPADLAPGERVLIDLSSVSESEFVAAQVLVQSYWDKVERFGGRLAVVLPEDREHLLQADLRQMLVRIGRPDGRAVLAQHLRWADVEVSHTELRRSALGPLLDRSPMRELQRLAELVVEARPRGGGFEAWAEQAVLALRERGHEVARQIAALTDGRQRALLFTAAMLDEAPVDAVFRLSTELLTKLGHPDDERPRLDQPDLTQRLQELGVKVTEGRIRFEALAYAPAVRSHFWLYYPDLCPAFGTWVADTVTGSDRLDRTERRKLVGRFTEQALQAGDVRVLTDLVESWAKETRLLPEALAVLDQGLRGERSGAAFRRKIYDWSTSPRVQPNLARGLARICVDVMAPHHPDQALVRLHQLARREPGHVQPHARSSLLELARTQERLYDRLLTRVREGMEGPDRWPRDVTIFLALVNPPPPDVRREQLVRGWRAALSAAPSEEWASGIEAWLSAARTERDGGERLTGVLIEAADGGTQVLSRYYLLACRWAAEPDDTVGRTSRADVAARFCREIDRAQGIEPLDLASAGATEGSCT